MCRVAHCIGLPRKLTINFAALLMLLRLSAYAVPKPAHPECGLSCWLTLIVSHHRSEAFESNAQQLVRAVLAENFRTLLDLFGDEAEPEPEPEAVCCNLLWIAPICVMYRSML
eukprot:SAG11_NODE_10034_length_861_cov_1.947507_2_plen_113_part_00